MGVKPERLIKRHTLECALVPSLSLSLSLCWSLGPLCEWEKNGPLCYFVCFACTWKYWLSFHFHLFCASYFIIRNARWMSVKWWGLSRPVSLLFSLSSSSIIRLTVQFYSLCPCAHFCSFWFFVCFSISQLLFWCLLSCQSWSNFVTILSWLPSRPTVPGYDATLSSLSFSHLLHSSHMAKV